MAAELLQAIGRVVFGGFFLIAAFRNFRNFSDRVARSGTNYGWALPAPLLAVGFVMQAAGGLALVSNVWPVGGAIVLIAFLCLATPLYHNPFMFQGKDRDPHLYLSLVNVTLAAGLLMVIANALPG
jgi:putative oxidoreductase